MKGIFNKKQVVNFKYEVQFFVGGGDTFEKYRVKTSDGTLYLLKLYNSSKLSRSEFFNQNLLEVDILDSLNIDGIANIFDNGEYVKDGKKYHYIVLNYVSGETLHDKMARDGVFSQYNAVSIMIRLLETLQKIHDHSQTIVHNNVNLGSVILDYSKKEKPPILTDFQAARHITAKTSSVDISRLSPFFIAPELYNGIFTPQSDIFSAGALLYNLIMGIPPWHLEIPKYQHTQEKFIEAISEQRNKNLTFGIKGFGEFDDQHIISVVEKALAVNVDDRFEDAKQFISALTKEQPILVSEFDTKKDSVPKKKKKKSGQGFAAIAGMQNLKDILYNDVIRALRETELYESYGITIPNGMLLYGPPGCGKTFISERFAEEVGFNFVQLGPSDIKSKYINQTEEKIGELFKDAAENAPTIIFIDEIDAVVPSREGGLHQMHAGPVNEFLTQMSNCSEKGIFVIAASNRPEKIDTAILRTGRIDRLIYLPPPDFEARAKMFKLYLKKRPIDLGLNYDTLANMTKNYVSSDIKFLVDEASRCALKERVRITQDIFDKVIAKTKPSVTHSELEKYARLKEEFENRK